MRCFLVGGWGCWGDKLQNRKSSQTADSLNPKGTLQIFMIRVGLNADTAA